MTLTDPELKAIINELRSKYKKVYSPLKYFRGLKTKAQVHARYKKMLKNDYEDFKTDQVKSTRTSSYTLKFRKKFPEAKTLKEISSATKIPIKILDTVYKRGLAAWSTGHRVGANQHAWALARVHSYCMKGKTYYTSDSDLHSK